MTKNLALMFSMSLVLAGCASQKAELPEARCRAAGGSAQLGQQLDDHVKSLARMGAGAVRVEVVPFGVPIARKDVDPQRLNIEVDAQGVVQRLRCG